MWLLVPIDVIRWRLGGVLIPKYYYYFRYYQCCTFHKQNNISVDILKSEMLVAKNCLVKIKENFDINNIKKVVTEDSE